MNRTRLIVLLVCVVMAVSALAPMGAAADDDTTEPLTVSIDDDNVVTVTQNESPVANATVEVTATDENESYAGDDPYTTDGDGQVALETPDEPLDVTIEATDGDQTATIDATLEPVADGLAVSVDETNTVAVTFDGEAAANATVEVTATDENESYAGDDPYTTGDDGTVTLAEPEEPLAVTIDATLDNETATTDATLEPIEEDEPENFGSLVSAFVADNKNETDGPFGIAVAGFVVENNPGNAPDHAGPPSDDTQGPPAHAGPADNESDDRQGPPADAGPADDDDDDDETVDTESDDDRQGPPDDAGPD